MKILGMLILLSSLFIPGTSFAQEPPSVKVQACKQNLPDGNVRYYYQLTNNSEHAVVAVRIGYDYYHGNPELSVPPVGWDYYTGLPSNTSTSPTGWHLTMITQEESNYHFIEWVIDNAASALPSGKTLQGLSVILPQTDDAYLNSHFDVILGDSTDVSAPLEVFDCSTIDVTPPTISVELTPNIIWPPNKKMVEITAKINVSDDRDPNPSVKLESITCNQEIEPGDIAGADFGKDDRIFSLKAWRTGKRKEGRIYTITYSATDASGNTATATATVMVPHDQRN